MSRDLAARDAQHGAFFLADHDDDGDAASCASSPATATSSARTLSNHFQFGEGLRRPGGARDEADPRHQGAAGLRQGHVGPRRGRARSTSWCCRSSSRTRCWPSSSWPRCTPFAEVNLSFLEQLAETIGVVLSTIIANGRTEELLEQSAPLTQELQSQSEELQSQQDELKRSNTELEEQAQSLSASEELLQTQQEELRQTNEELQEKAALLGPAEPRHRGQERRDRARPARRSRNAPRSSRCAPATSASSWPT